MYKLDVRPHGNGCRVDLEYNTNELGEGNVDWFDSADTNVTGIHLEFNDGNPKVHFIKAKPKTPVKTKAKSPESPAKDSDIPF